MLKSQGFGYPRYDGRPLVAGIGSKACRCIPRQWARTCRRRGAVPTALGESPITDGTRHLKKNGSSLLEGFSMRYAFIRDHRAAIPVNLLCQVLEVGPSGFYAWLQRSESPRSLANRRLLVEIEGIHQRSRRTYGSPRIHADLKAHGHACGKHRVARLMRTHGIVSRHKRKCRATTNLKHSHPVAPNLLNRQFTVAAPNRWWVSDITYIPTQEGWLY